MPSSAFLTPFLGKCINIKNNFLLNIQRTERERTRMKASYRKVKTNYVYRENPPKLVCVPDSRKKDWDWMHLHCVALALQRNTHLFSQYDIFPIKLQLRAIVNCFGPSTYIIYIVLGTSYSNFKSNFIKTTLVSIAHEFCTN